METMSNIILVPYDFTEVADFAVEHAVLASRKIKADVALLHIVKKETQLDEFQVKLGAKAADLSKCYGVVFRSIVKDGTIFKTINKMVDELNCVLVVMGTHGMKGMQKLTGSWALKVIVGSKVPYLVVQDSPVYDEQLNVLFPIDFRTESKEKLKWLSFLGQYFKLSVILFAQANKDGVLEVATKANLVFSKNYLDDRAIRYEVEITDGKSNHHEEALEYAQKRNAHMIVITTTRDIAFHDYVLGAYEQFIIANEYRMPVFVVNPRTDLMKYGYGNFG